MSPAAERAWTAVALALGLAALPACYTVRHHRSAVVPEPAPALETWRHAFLFGLVDASGPVRLEEACPQGVARVESRVGLPQALAQALTVALWTPSSVKVWCASTGRLRIPGEQERAPEPAAPAR
jgi:Bor protein